MAVKKQAKDLSKMSKRLQNKVIRNAILFVLFLIMFIFSVVNLIRWAVYNGKAESLKNQLIESSFSEIPKDKYANTRDTKKKNPVDFDSLKDKNTDTVAWIKIPGTTVDYPVVQTTNNEYYLHKDFDRKYSTCGWIFMDFKNSAKMIDKNTVLYGHNIKSGIMFADLQKILDNEIEGDVNIEVYTPYEKLNYKVFSSYMTYPDDYAIKSNIVDDETQGAFIREMLDRSETIYNLVPYKTDKVLTLSTCDDSGSQRILIHAVYVGGEIYKY